MIAVLQRVKSASVVADGIPAGKCGQGFLILLGVLDGDTEEEALLLAEKISKFRIFSDENDKMNLSVGEISGSILVVSNFTLCADNKKGNRPSFTDSAPPAEADRLYKYFCSKLLDNG